MKPRGRWQRAYFRKENVGIGLVFQHFEECHHIENFIGMLRPERFQRTTEDPCAGQKLAAKLAAAEIEFHAGSVSSRRPTQRAQKYRCRTPTSSRRPALRGERVRQEKSDGRVRGKHTRVALAIHRGIPGERQAFYVDSRIADGSWNIGEGYKE